jgi:hypothetical protein
MLRGEDSSERQRVCGEWIRFPAILILFLKSREILAKFPGKWKMGTHSHERWTDDVICGVRDVFGAKFAITPKKQKEALLLHRTKYLRARQHATPRD